MPHEVFDLNPVEYLTTDAVGEPGNRVFYLQGRKGSEVVTLICEKEHVSALALAIEQLLLSLVEGKVEAVIDPDPVLETGMALQLPLDPLFRVSQLNLGYEQMSGQLVVIAYELLAEDDPATPSVARFWATQAQMRALAIHADQVVAAGRPTCAMCGQPIDPEGHFCPRKNGHRT